MSTTDTEPWPIKRLLSWTTDYLQKQGSSSPRLEAEVLLSHVLDWPRIQLYAKFDYEPDEHKRSAFRQLILSRAKGTPVAYLIGHREFYSLDFIVDPNVLIPRPETEFLVVRALDKINQRRNQGLQTRILDIGTGSGAIAITLAVQAPDAIVTAVDVSDQALGVARKNAERHQVTDRVEFRTSDLFSTLESDAPFDLIVSNPPYIGEREKPQLDRDVLDFEPALALFSGDDGTQLSRRLIQEAPMRLVPGGELLIESSPMIIRTLKEFAEQTGCWQDASITKDLSGLERVLSLSRSAC